MARQGPVTRWLWLANAEKNIEIGGCASQMLQIGCKCEVCGGKEGGLYHFGGVAVGVP
jgi:hypothetical protein